MAMPPEIRPYVGLNPESVRNPCDYNSDRFRVIRRLERRLAKHRRSGALDSHRKALEASPLAPGARFPISSLPSLSTE